jgi:hypothetical protein
LDIESQVLGECQGAATQINPNPAVNYTQPAGAAQTSDTDMTTDCASTTYQFKRLKDLLIQDGDADSSQENYDGQ